MAVKHKTQRSLKFLAIKDMHIKTTLIFYLILNRMVKINKTMSSRCWWQRGESGKQYCNYGNQCRESSREAETIPTPNPATPYTQWSLRPTIDIYTCVSILIAALFITLKQPRCSSTDGWLMHMWHICIMGYYPAVQKNEIKGFAGKCLESEKNSWVRWTRPRQTNVTEPEVVCWLKGKGISWTPHRPKAHLRSQKAWQNAQGLHKFESDNVPECRMRSNPKVLLLTKTLKQLILTEEREISFLQWSVHGFTNHTPGQGVLPGKAVQHKIDFMCYFCLFVCLCVCVYGRCIAFFGCFFGGYFFSFLSCLVLFACFRFFSREKEHEFG